MDMPTAKREQGYTRMNFRCSPELRGVLEEAAERSGVSLSEQTRKTLMEAFELPEHNVWLPPRLQRAPKR